MDHLVVVCHNPPLYTVQSASGRGGKGFRKKHILAT
jgi:hypothetical protein